METEFEFFGVKFEKKFKKTKDKYYIQPYVPVLNRLNVEVANFYIFCSSNGPTSVCKISQKDNDKQKSYTRFSKTPSYPLTLRSV